MLNVEDEEDLQVERETQAVDDTTHENIPRSMFVEVDDKDEKEDRDPELRLFDHYETIDDSTTGKETIVFFKLTSTAHRYQ